MFHQRTNSEIHLSIMANLNVPQMDAFKYITMSIQRFKDDLEFTINWCRQHGLVASEMVCVHC